MNTDVWGMRHYNTIKCLIVKEGHEELHRKAFILLGERDNPLEEVKEHIIRRVRECIIREFHEEDGRV